MLLLEGIVLSMKNAISSVACNGILGGNSETAEAVIKTAASRSAGNKRGKKQLEGSNQPSENPVVRDLDLFMNTLVRMISSGDSVLISIACDMCTAEANFLYHNETATLKDPTLVAEYELLASFTKNILLELDKALKSVVQKFPVEYSLLSPGRETKDDAQVAYTCSRTASALFRTFRTKLSRNPSKAGLTQNMLLLLTCTDDYLSLAAARYLAIVLGTGDTQGTNPSEVWETKLREVVHVFQRWIAVIIPFGSKQAIGNDSPNLEQGPLHIAVKEYEVAIFEAESLEAKTRIASTVTRSLAYYLSCLLTGHSLCGSVSKVPGLSMNVHDLLNLIQKMLSSATQIDRVFFETKKRLRHEPLASGMSVSQLAENMAPVLKTTGLALLVDLLDSLGCNELLPDGRRILKIAKDSFTTSCSSVLRNSLDSTFSLEKDSKRQRWNHQSLSLRTNSIIALKTAISTFGVDPVGKSGPMVNPFGTNSTIEEVIPYLCGSILDQYTSHGDVARWGSKREREAILVSCADCLREIFLLSAAENISVDSRGMVETMIETILSSTAQTSSDFYTCSSPSVALSFMCLLRAISTKPWADGSRSDLLTRLDSILSSLMRIGNALVSQNAKELLALNESFTRPAAPALKVVARDDRTDGPSFLMNKLEKSTESYLRILQEMKNDELVTKKRKVRDSAHIDNAHSTVASESLTPASHETPSHEVATKKESAIATDALSPMENDIREAESRRQIDDIGSNLPIASAKPDPVDSDSDDDSIPMIVDSAPDKEDL